MTGDTPAEVAETYTEALENQVDTEEFHQAQERLDGLRERLEAFEETYGNSDPATQELKEKVQSAEAKVEELKHERREPEELERELLERATRFMLDDKWLQADVIEALNRALVETPYSTLRVDDIELSEPNDIEELDELTRYDIIDVVRKLVRDKLGESDDIRQVWQSIKGTTKEEPFQVVSETGEASPDDIVNSIDEDIERGVARNRLKSAVYQLDISPYHRENGTYYLSTAGRYIATHYATPSGDGEQEPTAGTAEENEQMRLNEETIAVDGGNDNDR